ncbi:transcriptional regulator ATRX-like isoform X2 [Drosophila willistoni]|uniref:transcriptional regulator ATRX-like isoform X2 n=1 Tax=Drosophila willistoni TaxID=7260 RepID=UPI001F077595|nr:transcriptional regulator ATRX-like isoform X2 [Drosophila willistoni]
MPVDADILQDMHTSVHFDNNVVEFINYSFSKDEIGGELNHSKMKCFKNKGIIFNALSDHNYTSQETGSSQQNLYTIREMLLNQIFLNGFSYQCIPKSVSCFIDSTLAKIQILQFESRRENVKDSQKSSEATIASDVPENCSEPLEVDLSDEYFEHLYKNVVKNNNALKILLARTIGFARELFNDCKSTTIKSEYAFNLFILGKIQKLRNILTIDSKNIGTQTFTSTNRFLKKRSQQNYDAKIKLLRRTSSSSTLDSNIDDTQTKINMSTCESHLGLSKLTSIRHCKNYTHLQKPDFNDEIDLSKYIKLDVNCRKFKEDSWIDLNEDISSDDDTDKEIERLTNLNGLKRRYAHQVHSKTKEVTPWKPLYKKIAGNNYELEDNLDSYETDNSLKKSEDEIITEHQYLSRCNDQIKHELLNDSTSDSGQSDYYNLSKESCSDKEDDKAIDIVEKFLQVFKSEPPYDEGSNSGTDLGNEIEVLPKDCDIFIESTEVSNCIFNRKKPFKKSFKTTLFESDKRKKHEEIVLSSESEFSEIEAVEAEPTEEKSRLIKPMLRIDQLANETRAAQKSESDRIKRLEKQHTLLSKALKNNAMSIKNDELILDYIESEKTFIKVDADIVKQLKPHQIDGVRFMYDSCFGGSNHNLKVSGSGCILAHCMGLGKTLQLIALLHTVISYQVLNTKKVMILCPKSTVMNWADEFHRWLGPLNRNNHIKIYVFPDSSDISEKLRLLEEWSLSSSKKAGCLLVGYEAFRTLVFYHSYKNRGNFTSGNLEIIRNKVKKYLLEPGSDLVVCDEGHIIKNSKSAISLAVAQIKTTKRIILTGTPIQNNLKEYYSMVNFIKPLYLGTEREFANLYANPIKNGQHKDSGKKDITVMKQRSYVLHKKLSKFVQRKEAELLKTFLPQKFEYVLFIPMTDVQNTLYEYILDAISIRGDSRGKSLITDYTVLRKIWTHPKVLEDAWKNANIQKIKKDARKVSCPHSDDDQPDDIYDRQTGVISVTNDWWRQYLSKMDLETIMPSNKLRTMFAILRLCEEKGEKCLIFSAFVAVLNVVEYFLKKINESDTEILQNIHIPSNQSITNKWIIGQDYYRLDGKTPKHIRHEMIKRFNNESNRRARVFLISAKAGGQGINLVGANRVIILDTSWNPSNDQQNIFRIFRLGQKKNCYIYRLISMGTMEEKVYSRSVTKQAMSFRVVDEQQIDRHYNMAELAELYTLTKPQKSERTVPVLPKDTILAYLLRQSDLVYKYHEHDSLLESKIEQELSEQEKADAWETYEKELQLNFTQQDILNTDRVQNIWSSKSGPNSCLTVPNLDQRQVGIFYLLHGDRDRTQQRQQQQQQQ